jgi:hypothetical protein
MNDQNQSRIEPDSGDKPEVEQKKPAGGGKPPQRKSPRHGAPKPGSCQFGIEPLPKR